MADRPVVTLGVSVLLYLSGLDVVQGNSLFLGPDHQRGADVFRDFVKGHLKQWRARWQAIDRIGCSSGRLVERI